MVPIAFACASPLLKKSVFALGLERVLLIGRHRGDGLNIQILLMSDTDLIDHLLRLRNGAGGEDVALSAIVPAGDAAAARLSMPQNASNVIQIRRGGEERMCVMATFLF